MLFSMSVSVEGGVGEKGERLYTLSLSCLSLSCLWLQRLRDRASYCLARALLAYHHQTRRLLPFQETDFDWCAALKKRKQMRCCRCE